MRLCKDHYSTGVLQSGRMQYCLMFTSQELKFQGDKEELTFPLTSELAKSLRTSCGAVGKCSS